MSYAKALAALESYEPRRLGYGQMRSSDGLCCTLGAVLGGDPHGLSDYEYYRRRAAIGDAVTRQRIAGENDRLGVRETPEQRYVRMVAWLREQVAAEQAATQ